MRRRELLAGLGAAGASALVGRAAPQRSIGLQLYTLREPLARDFEGTLERVAEIGFREVELAGHHDRTPHQMRAVLDRLALTAPASHVPAGTLDGSLEAALEAASVLGHRYLICPWIAPEERRSIDDYLRWADRFNRWGERCRAAGRRFGYHNHAFEFEPIEGQIPYERLLERASPDLVRLELDLYWIHRAGRDPAQMLRALGERVELVHVKDATREGTFTEVGRGVLDWPSILAAVAEIGVRHSFVEQDRTEGPPLESVRASFAYLRSLESQPSSSGDLTTG